MHRVQFLQHAYHEGAIEKSLPGFACTSVGSTFVFTFVFRCQILRDIVTTLGFENRCKSLQISGIRDIVNCYKILNYALPATPQISEDNSLHAA